MKSNRNYEYQTAHTLLNGQRFDREFSQIFIPSSYTFTGLAVGLGNREDTEPVRIPIAVVVSDHEACSDIGR